MWAGTLSNGHDGRGVHQPHSDRGTEANGTLGEDCDNVADAHGPLSAPANPVDMMSGHIKHLLVAIPRSPLFSRV
jgi:hypothetical protein